jgi:hypothetical protein
MTESNLVFRNEKIISETSENFIKNIPLFQNVVDQFAVLNVGSISTRDELIEAVESPETFLMAKITNHVENEKPTFAGLKIKPEKFIELMDIDDRERFLQSCRNAKLTIRYFVELGTIKKGKVEADLKLTEALIKRNEIYALTDKQKAIFAAMKEISNSMQVLIDVGAFQKFAWDRYLSALVRQNTFGKFSLNSETFSMIAR